MTWGRIMIISTIGGLHADTDHGFRRAACAGGAPSGLGQSAAEPAQPVQEIETHP